MRNILLLDIDKIILGSEMHTGLDEYARDAARLSDMFYMTLSSYIEYLADGERDYERVYFDKYVKKAISYISDCDGVIVGFDIDEKYFPEAHKKICEYYDVVGVTSSDVDTEEIEGIKLDGIVRIIEG